MQLQLDDLRPQTARLMQLDQDYVLGIIVNPTSMKKVGPHPLSSDRGPTFELSSARERRIPLGSPAWTGSQRPPSRVAERELKAARQARATVV